jgi:EpsI family protein
MLFGLARLMLVLQRSPMTLSDALDLDFDRLAPQAARLARPEASAALVVAVVLMGGTAAAWHLAPERPRPEIVREPLMFFPPRLGEWRSGPAQVLDPAVAQVLGADDYRGSSFIAPGARAPVDFFVAWYEDQTRGGIHSPEVCLPGAGWEIAQINRVDLAPRLASPEAFPVNRAIIQKGFDRVLVYYWFEQYGGRIAWDFAAKMALVVDGIRHGRTDGALVRLSTQIRPDETEADAEGRLLGLLQAMLPALPRFVPKAAAD